MFVFIAAVLSSAFVKEITGSSTFCEGKTGRFYPYMEDCAKFIECYSGQTYVKDCGPGTLWNQGLTICAFTCDQNHPELQGGAGTSTEPTATSTTTTVQPTTTTDQSTTQTSTATTTTDQSTTQTSTATTTTVQSPTQTSTATTQTTTQPTTQPTTSPETTIQVPCDTGRALTISSGVGLGCPPVMEMMVISRTHCLNECVKTVSCDCVVYNKSNYSCSLLNCDGGTYPDVAASDKVSICF